MTNQEILDKINKTLPNLFLSIFSILGEIKSEEKEKINRLIKLVSVLEETTKDVFNTLINKILNLIDEKDELMTTIDSLNEELGYIEDLTEELFNER